MHELSPDGVVDGSARANSSLLDLETTLPISKIGYNGTSTAARSGSIQVWKGHPWLRTPWIRAWSVASNRQRLVQLSSASLPELRPFRAIHLHCCCKSSRATILFLGCSLRALRKSCGLFFRNRSVSRTHCDRIGQSPYTEGIPAFSQGP